MARQPATPDLDTAPGESRPRYGGGHRPANRPYSLAEHNRLLGEHGETIAARHLVSRGMTLLDRNWSCPQGEIDLVLRDGRVLVICEVKTRTSEAFGAPLEAVDQRKLDRLRRLAGAWLRAHQVHPDDVRIDLVGVLAPSGGEVEIDHVAGVA